MNHNGNNNIEYNNMKNKSTIIGTIIVILLHAGNYTDFTGDSHLKMLLVFAFAVLSISHSNVQCETIFNTVNLIKTKTSSRSVTTTINGALLSSACVKGTREDRCDLRTH